MSKSNQTAAEETARYELTEPFYDGLVLHEQWDEISWAGIPSPTMIPLNAAAEAALEKINASSYVPPLSEQPDTMDGRVTVQPFHPGDRKGRAAKVPAFPKTPSKETKTGAVKVGQKAAPDASIPPMVIPKKPTKNFDRAPR